MPFIVTITDQEEIRRMFSAVFGEHYLSFWEKLGGWVVITPFWIALPISTALQLPENLSPFWRCLAWIGAGGFALFVLAAHYDALQMRISITRNEISRRSPLGWFSWSIPTTAISSLRVRSSSGALIVTITDTSGRKRSFRAPPSVAWNLGPATGLHSQIWSPIFEQRIESASHVFLV
jgi:hypothetical protein